MIKVKVEGIGRDLVLSREEREELEKRIVERITDEDFSFELEDYLYENMENRDFMEELTLDHEWLNFEVFLK